MLHALQILPLALYALVGFHLRHRLGPLEAVAVILLDEVGKNQGIGALAAIFRQHADEHQVYGVGLVQFQCLHYLPPAPRQQLAVAYFLQGIGERREGYAEAYQAVVIVAIHHTGDKVRIGYLDVGIHITINLLLGECWKS